MFVSFRKKYSTVTYNLLTSWLMTQCMCHIEREESFESAQVIGSEDAENAESENTGLENAKTI